jgi:hypothetical protein
MENLINRGLLLGSLITMCAFSSGAIGQLDNPNITPNPYDTVPNTWAPLPDDREWGATSTVYYAGEGNVWAAERCGANGNCLDTPELDPIFLIARGDTARMKGHQVHKFSSDGELLMSLGLPGVAGKGNNIFDQPNDVLVAPNGDIFVADGHSSNGNNRIVKFNSAGEYLMEWGGKGTGSGQLDVPHALAMDSTGRLFVADRGNSRLQIFDQEGTWLATWTQFGRPSGLYIDGNDTLYSADSESNTGPGRNPGWYRGIRIGSAETGFVEAFIPDPNTGEANGTSVAEGVTADEDGNVYGAEVAQRALRKYMRQR